MIDGGLFTAPPSFEHSGAGLLDAEGRLIGIGSLWVSDVLDRGVAFPGNMFVPVDLLKPLLGDLLATGRSRQPADAGADTAASAGHEQDGTVDHCAHPL